jgi:hypothetical protein
MNFAFFFCVTHFCCQVRARHAPKEFDTPISTTKGNLVPEDCPPFYLFLLFDISVSDTFYPVGRSAAIRHPRTDCCPGVFTLSPSCEVLFVLSN